MFLRRRPTPEEIETFLVQSKALPLSYRDVGIAGNHLPGFNLDEAVASLGTGAATFSRGRAALAAWRHFELGWVELFPRAAPVEPGTTVAVLVKHLGFWSLNGCRVVYSLDGSEPDGRFGFAYGTLTNHAELGEEMFSVALCRETGQVTYSIRAVSRPSARLARLGGPIVRALQAKFRRDSGRAMQRAVE